MFKSIFSARYSLRCISGSASSGHTTNAHWASTETAIKSTSNNPGKFNEYKEEQISIPKRVQRNPTELLKALKSTILYNQANPHYKYHDDPYLIPNSNIAKRIYSLSRESGRKTAKWIRNQYPTAFKKDIAEPQIERLMPKLNITNENATLELLKQSIATADVTSATTVFDILTLEGKSIDDEAKQSYLELQCFYNGQESIDDDLFEEKWFHHSLQKENKKIWLSSNPAENLFQKMELKDANSYSAMICGLAKYNKGDQAFKLYDTMKELKLALNVTTYNHLIRCCFFVKETSEARWQLVEELLRNMKEDRIRPNLLTMNAALEMIAKLGTWRDSKKQALRVMAEMRYLEIEPSLASYYSLLSIFCRNNGPRSTILYDIMEILKEKEFVIKDPNDVRFFVTAMEVCHTHVNDFQLAYEVDNLLNYKDNYNFIGDSMKETFYYQHFFKILCAQDTFQNFYEVYNKLTPHVYTPEPSVIVDIIKAIYNNGAWEHIASIWSDIVLFEHTSRSNIIQELLFVMAAKKPNNEEICNQWANIAWDIKTRIDEDKLKRTMAVIWTGDMLGNLLTIFLNCGYYEKACQIMKKCDSEQLSITGMPSDEQLINFGKATIEKQDGENGLLCSKYMIDAGYLDGSNLAAEILKNVNVPESIRFSLQQIANVDDHKENDSEKTTETF